MSLRSKIGLLLVGIVLALLGGEWFVRDSRLRPRAQIVSDRHVRVVDGVPFWDEDPARWNRACADEHPERTRVLFFGSSITYGSGLPPEESFTVELERRLNAAQPSPGFCVMNFGQPGFSFEQKLLVAKREAARYPGSLLMWEDWSEWFRYGYFAGAAHGIQGFALRADGFIGVRGVPDLPNRLLFTHSRLYEYVAIAFGERLPGWDANDDLPAFVRDRLPEVPRLARASGSRLAMYLAPALDQSFADSVRAPPRWHEPVLAFARGQGIPAFQLQKELVDRDYLRLRQDPCCHYNADGHRALAEVFARIVPRLLGPGDAHAAGE